MRTTAAKSAKSHSATVTRAQGFFSGSSGGFFGQVARKAGAEGVVQTKLAVSKPADPLEKEADRAAERVMRMPAPERVQSSPGAPAAPSAPRTVKEDKLRPANDDEKIQRAAKDEKARPPSEQKVLPPAEDTKGAAEEKVQRAAKDDTVQRFGEGAPSIVKDAQSPVVTAATGGQALTPDVRDFMEPRLGAELGDVRVHSDENAHSLSSHLSARAFTYRNHVFFGRGEYQPGTQSGRQLLAHELTHTVQQGAATRRAKVPEVQRTPAPSATAPMIQRYGVEDALEFFADKANYIPGFRMLTLVLGFNPITMNSVPRNAANFLRALIEMIPGGAVITRVLDAHGVINDAAAWVEQKVTVLGDLGSTLSGAVSRFLSGLGLTDLVRPWSLWDRAKRIVTDPVARLVAFGTGVVRELLDLVKKAILRPLAALAKDTAGYDLLKAVLSEDPITGDPVPQDAETLIGGFMKLIGQEEIWQNIKKGNAVNRAFAWFKGALAGLMAFVRSVPRRIVQTITSLTFEDVVTIVGAFRKVGSAFAGMVGEFFSWAGGQVLSLLEILVSVVAPGVMPYIAKAKAAFHTIIRDPVRFVGNLVRAGKLGFQNFAKNILTHLQTALIKWITGPLGDAGVYIPQSFSLLEIVKLVLSVLGLTWQSIRTKLVKIIPEPILVALEKTAGVLVTLATQGPAAAWEQIKAELSELKDQLIGQVTQMISTEILKAAVTKLVSMLNPAGAVIQAIIAIYNTVMFFVEKAKQIGAVIASFIDSIAAIAAGQVDGAAKKVEATLANTLTVVLAFLARFAGLGGIPGKIVGIVKKIRAPIDRALDRIVAWLGKMLDKLVSKAKDAAKKLLQWWKKKVPIPGGDKPHSLTFQGERKAAKLVVQSVPMQPSVFLRTEATKANKEKEADDGVKKTEKDEKGVAKVQADLATIDGASPTAPSGGAKDKAVEWMAQLDTLLAGLAATITDTLVNKIGFKDDDVVGVSLPRSVLKYDKQGNPKLDAKGRQKKKSMAVWTPTQKLKIKAEHERMGGDPNRLDDKGNLAEPEKYDRRHVVSLKDIGEHYEKSLNGKKVSAAKVLLEQRGSISDSRTPVESPLGVESIRKAALKRWRGFFGYARNIFVGDFAKNRALGRRLDPDHPEMAGDPAKLQDHVDRIKREWAMDNSFTPTP